MFCERLISARKMAGLSLEQLAQKMGDITKQALSNYEKGKREPDSATIILLSKALNVRPDYFFYEETNSLGSFEYRKKSKLSFIERNMIEEKAKFEILRYLEVESLLGINIIFENPLNNIIVKNTNDVEKAAVELRNKWNLGSDAISNLAEVFEDNGIKIAYVDSDNNFDGAANYADSIPVIMLNKNVEDVTRLRFTLCHELAHLLLNLKIYF